MAVGDRLLSQIGVDRGAADADQHRKVMDVEAFAGAHVERGEGAELLAHEMRMHGAGGEDHRDRRALAIHRRVRQDHVSAAAAHRFFGLLADAADRVAQRVFAAIGGEGAVDLGGGLAHVGAHRLELGVRQHGRIQLQQLALAVILVEDVAEIAEPGVERHHPRLAQAVDRRIGDLAEVLPEEVMQAAIVVRQHRQRRVVAHRADGFLGVGDHRLQDQLDVLEAPAERHLAPAQLFACAKLDVLPPCSDLTMESITVMFFTHSE